MALRLLSAQAHTTTMSSGRPRCTSRLRQAARQATFHDGGHHMVRRFLGWLSLCALLSATLTAQQNATVQGTVVDESESRDARRHGDRHRDQAPAASRSRSPRPTAVTGSRTCRPANTSCASSSGLRHRGNRRHRAAGRRRTPPCRHRDEAGRAAGDGHGQRRRRRWSTPPRRRWPATSTAARWRNCRCRAATGRNCR